MNKAAILNPVAMTTGTNKGGENKTWFDIKAKSNNQAEISIYDEIGGWGVSAQQFATDLKALGSNIKQIDLHIHSPGGSVFDGIAIFNLLKNHPANKTVYIDGLAASMASVIAMVGNKVIMPENAMMMIHKPWGIQGGDADDMRKYADLLDKLEATLIPAYASKTGKTEEELAQMLAVETWLNGKEAVEQGFADELAEPVQAMAQIQSKRLEDYKNMPNSLKNMLFKPQGNAGATPAQNATPAAQPVAEPAVNQVNPPAVAQAVDNSAQVKAEMAKRVDSIKAVFAPFGSAHQDLIVDCLGDINITAEQAKDKLLARLGSGTTPSTPNNVATYASNGNIVGDSIAQALLSRAGFDKDKANAKDNNYTGMSLRELARAALIDRGVSVSGQSATQVVGLAFTHTSSDFGSILLDVAHKSVLEGWNNATENYEQFTTKGTVTDFRKHSRVGLDGFGTLPVVGEGEEYSYGTLGDKQVDVAIATYGKMFSITRQAIINDDMGMLTRIPMLMGQSARATVAKLVFALITGNTKLADGKPLFDASRKNLTTNAALDVANIAKMITAMNGFVDANGEPLAIEPEFLLAPTSLYFSAKQILESESVAGADNNSGITNPIRNLLTPIKSPRLQASDAKTWYGINKRAIEVNYLDGNDSPYLETEHGFTVDGVQSKVRIDVGVNVIDPRGLHAVTNS